MTQQRSATQQQRQQDKERVSLITPAIKALIGMTGEVVEAWHVVDAEYLRRFAEAVPDRDPLYWDEELAKKSKFKELTVPPAMASFISGRKPLWEEDRTDEMLREDPTRDGGDTRARGSLPPIPTHLRRHLHAGDAQETFKYPSIGDKIYSQRKYANIEERIGSDGNQFLLITSETRYFNQNGEDLCIVRTQGITR